MCVSGSHWSQILPQLSYRVIFFQSGQHWTHVSVPYLPVGEGLVDIAGRIAAFRLKTAQRLLYGKGLLWADTACMLLQQVEDLRYDRPEKCGHISHHQVLSVCSKSVVVRVENQ